MCAGTNARVAGLSRGERKAQLLTERRALACALWRRCWIATAMSETGLRMLYARASQKYAVVDQGARGTWQEQFQWGTYAIQEDIVRSQSHEGLRKDEQIHECL